MGGEELTDRLRGTRPANGVTPDKAEGEEKAKEEEESK